MLFGVKGMVLADFFKRKKKKWSEREAVGKDSNILFLKSIGISFYFFGV